MSGKYQYQWVCDDRPAIALPESYLNDQFNYYLDVLSGFPVDTKSKKTRPQYRQTYQWMAKDLVTVGRDSCLYANSWYLPPLLLLLPSYIHVNLHTEKIVLGYKGPNAYYECVTYKLEPVKLPAGYYVKHILGDQVGVCPPSNYDLSEKELFPNPYYMREEARKAANSQTTTTSDFVADNAAGVPNPNIPEDPVINTPVEFSAEGSLLPHTADKVAYGTMDFFSGDT